MYLAIILSQPLDDYDDLAANIAVLFNDRVGTAEL
jgi:hypothetical protein